MTSTSVIQKTNAPDRTAIELALAAAVNAFCQICNQQMDLGIETRGKPREWKAGRILRGSRIELVGPGCTWSLAVACNELTAMVLTRILFAMEVKDLPGSGDIEDALGEIVNLIGGLFKSVRARDGEHLDLGLPVFVRSGGKGFGIDGAPCLAQHIVTTDELSLEIILSHKLHK